MWEWNKFTFYQQPFTTYPDIASKQKSEQSNNQMCINLLAIVLNNNDTRNTVLTIDWV